MPPYSYTGPVDVTAPLDTGKLSGKTAIVTGGANGIGEGYVRALVSHKVHVVIADLNSERGVALESELPNTKFVKCNVTSWSDQLNLFKTAISFSPTKKIHYVVANAGMINADSVYDVSSATSDPDADPTEPTLQTIEVNLKGTMYTTKLALHHFVKQNGVIPSPHQEDTALILIGSGASYLDGPRSPQYAATKWAMRGIMHSLRQTSHFHRTRVNMISPWYIKTSILTQEQFEHVTSAGVQFAELEDAQAALLRLLSDTSINGKSLFVGARRWEPARETGYWDLDVDDHHDELHKQIQEEQMWAVPVSLGAFVQSH